MSIYMDTTGVWLKTPNKTRRLGISQQGAISRLRGMRYRALAHHLTHAVMFPGWSMVVEVAP